MPCGFVDGLPVGLQLMGAHFEEGRMLNVAHRYQQATDWHRAGARRRLRLRRPSTWNGKPSSGWKSTPSSPPGSKIFSGASTAYGAAPNTQACLVDLGYPGVLPVLNNGAVRMAVALRPRDRVHRGRPLGVRAQELLLSGSAQGLPDQPVRAAHRARRAASRSPRGRRPQDRRHHPRAPRGRRRQVAARGFSRHDAASTSTVPARRCWRSCPSPTCARRRKRSPT